MEKVKQILNGTILVACNRKSGGMLVKGKIIFLLTLFVNVRQIHFNREPQTLLFRLKLISIGI